MCDLEDSEAVIKELNARLKELTGYAKQQPIAFAEESLSWDAKGKLSLERVSLEEL